MKDIQRGKSIMLMALVILSFSASAQNSIADEMRAIMVNMKKYSLAIANQCPADEFYKTPDELDVSFGQHFKQLRNLMDIEIRIIKKEEINVRDFFEKAQAYEQSSIPQYQVINDLSVTFDRFIEFLETTEDRDLNEKVNIPFFKEEFLKPRFFVMMVTRDNITHHLSQTRVYLQLSGIQPVPHVRF